MQSRGNKLYLTGRAVIESAVILWIILVSTRYSWHVSDILIVSRARTRLLSQHRTLFSAAILRITAQRKLYFDGW